MKILFFQYPSCSTCKKAAKWLKDHDIDIESKHIVETPPTVGELTEWITRSNLPLQKFFNTSGQKYRELNLKNRISTIPEKELIELLAHAYLHGSKRNTIFAPLMQIITN